MTLDPQDWDHTRAVGRAMVDAHPDLERLAPAPLNIVCFRRAPASGAELAVAR